MICLILRSPPQAGVSKDEAAPCFETRFALLSMKPMEAENSE